MNLKGFKKVHDDDEKAILKNAHGHSITISKKALSSKLASDLGSLPLHASDGADVESSAPPTSEEQPDYDPGTAPPQAATAQVTPATSIVQQAQQQTAGVQDPNLSADQKQEYLKQDQAWAQDLANGHITPMTYADMFAKKSTLGKIGTIFGLMLGGAGAGLAHQPNGALEMMKQEIQNDLEAQKKSKDNAHNFLRLNQDHQMQQAQIGQIGAQTKLTDAEANTKAFNLSNMQMNQAALHHLVQQTQKLPVGSPQRQQAEAGLAMLSQQVQAENFNIADRAAAMSGLSNMLTPQGAGQSNPEQKFQQTDKALRVSGNTALAQDMESKHYPGLKGQASVPIAGEDKAKLDSGFQFQQQLQRFTDWTKKHSGDLSPSDINAGRAMAADLQGAYRQATHGGVYKEGEQNFISKLIDQEPTKFFNNIRVLPQLKALAKENEGRMNETAKHLGFEGYSAPKPESKEPKEGTTGTHGGRPVIFQSGKWSYR